MTTQAVKAAPAPAKAPRKVALDYWDPEDPLFWETSGRRIAWRNLLLSIPALLCAFAVWSFWSVITVQMKNLAFPFTTQQLFTLSAVAGLSGATLRIPHSFLIAIAGGRNVIALSTALLLLPALGTGIALQDRSTPFAVFVVLAALSGIGGGNFASSMSNISRFFPRRMQGLALGLNAGFGNLGVSLMQFFLPLAMAAAVFGSLSGAPAQLPAAVGPLPAGTSIWIQNAGLVWVPLVSLLAIAAWFGMNNLPAQEMWSTTRALLRVLGLTVVGYLAAAAGLWLLLGAGLSMWIALPVTVALCLALIRLSPVGSTLQPTFAIFRSRHNWIMTWLYVMTFGSFIGYSMAFPLLIRVVFGSLPDGSANPNAPNPFVFAWLGPLVGSLIRPIGGWLSDRWTGARVTQWSTALMIAAALGVAHYIKLASGSPAPELHFMPFLLLFLVLFLTAGIGNGSTFRMIPIIFDRTHAGPVLGWTSAIAAYGAFIIPHVIGAQVQAGHPQYALYGFAAYYVTCLALNWWFYARKGAEIPC